MVNMEKWEIWVEEANQDERRRKESIEMVRTFNGMEKGKDMENGGPARRAGCRGDR